MIVTSLAIAGGALASSVKVYRDKKRKKQYPWTVAAERIGVYPLVRQKRENRLIAIPKATLSKLKGLSRGAKEQQKRLFGAYTDSEQLTELTEGREQAEISMAEEEVNRLLAISGGLFVITSAGLWVPALNLLSLPAFLYIFMPILKKSKRLIIDERRLGLPVVDLIWLAGGLVTGHYLATSILFGFVYGAEKLLIKTEDRSMGNLVNIFSSQPRFIWLLVDGVEVEVPFESVKAGDIVIIQAGQTIAVDGIIQEGYATIDQRTLTGESQPVEKSLGEQVLASTIVLSGKIKVQVEKAGASTVAAQIGDILVNTANFQSGMRAMGLRVAEKAASPTLAFGALALLALGPEGAAAVFHAGFGYPLRASAPLAMLNFLRIASQEGVLIKDGRSLELLGQVDTVVFDKTGTLTEEIPTVGQIYAHLDDENELLRYTAAAEHKQTHPIAKAITREASKRDLSVPDIGFARVEVGYGLKVWVEERLVQVGSLRFMGMSGITIPSEYQQIQEAANHAGYSLVYVSIDDQFAGAIELRPTIRPEAHELIRELQQRNISTVIISGDNEAPTKKLAETLGIDRYFAETLPEDKANLIEQLQKAPKTMPQASQGGHEKKSIICFVGDGINDSIAMKKAQVSISLSGASSIATDTAGIILMDGTLSQLLPLFDIGKEFKSTIERGIVMSTLPGVLCIGGIFFLHWGIVPAMLFYQLNLGSNIANSMWPLLAHQRKKAQLTVK